MEKPNDNRDKRRYRRIKRKFAIEIHINFKDKSAMAGGDDIFYLQDISAGGALFSYNKEIRIGVLVDLSIRFSEYNTVRCLGRVIRVQPSNQPKVSGQPQLYDIALRFIESADKEKEAFLYRIIEEYHAKGANGKD